MKTIVITLLAIAGCSLYISPDPGAHTGAVDAADSHPECPHHTATIFAPSNGGTLSPAAVEVRVRWNEAGIPDRFMNMADDFGNFFISSDSAKVQGDGSIISHYDLPARGTFTLDVGWFCDAGNQGPTITLATIRFHTSS